MQKNPPLSREAGHLVTQQMERYSEDRRFKKRCFWLPASTRIIYHATASSFPEIGPHDVFIHCQKPIAIYGKGSEGVGVWMPTITLCHAGLPESSLEPVVTSRRFVYICYLTLIGITKCNGIQSHEVMLAFEIEHYI